MNDLQVNPDPYAQRMEEKLKRISLLQKGQTRESMLQDEIEQRLQFVAKQIIPVAEVLRKESQQAQGVLNEICKKVEAINPSDELLESLSEAEKSLQQANNTHDIISHAIHRSHEKLGIEHQQFCQLMTQLQNVEKSYRQTSKQIPHEHSIHTIGASLCHSIGTGRPLNS